MLNTSNEDQSGVSIAQQLNFIKNAVNDYCIEQGGIAVVTQTVNEKVMIGFNNSVGPRIQIVFVGEETAGPADISELLGWTRRYFDVIVQRGRLLDAPIPNSFSSTTGPTRPFSDQLEEIRDICRSIIWPVPMVQNPAEYRGIRPAFNDEWLCDKYIISFAVLTQIGRIQVEAPQLSTGPFVELSDPLPGVQFNKSY